MVPFLLKYIPFGEGNGNPLQCSLLENPRNGGAWWAAVCGVAQSQTRLKLLSSSSSKHMAWMTESAHKLYWLQTSLIIYISIHKNEGVFPGGPVVKTPRFQCREPRFNPWSGNLIPYAATKTHHSQIKTKKRNGGTVDSVCNDLYTTSQTSGNCRPLRSHGVLPKHVERALQTCIHTPSTAEINFTETVVPASPVLTCSCFHSFNKG